MSGAVKQRWDGIRAVCAALAFLALALQLTFPPGYMMAEPGHGLLVLCPAQGPGPDSPSDAMAGMDMAGMDMSGTDMAAAHDKAPAKSKSMATCPFAGHATGSTPPTPVAVAQSVAFVAAAAPTRPYLVFPGRGLAAPPPPAIGPPVLI
jgi:hypothetical protein